MKEKIGLQALYGQNKRTGRAYGRGARIFLTTILSEAEVTESIAITSAEEKQFVEKLNTDFTDFLFNKFA